MATLSISPTSPAVNSEVTISYTDSDGGLLKITSPQSSGFITTNVGSGTQKFPVSVAGNHVVELLSIKKKGKKQVVLARAEFTAV